MKLPVLNNNGTRVDDLEVSRQLFDAPMNKSLVHQVMVAYLANARQGTVAVKNRSRVSGGGAKPFAQKGTGRARQGTIRAPQMRGGGVVFGPEPRDHSHATPKRMKRSATRAVLSDKCREGSIKIIQELKIADGKTKEIVAILQTLGVELPALLVADGADGNVLRAARNIQGLSLLPASMLNSADLMKNKTIIMTVDAVRIVEQNWGRKISTDNQSRSLQS